MEKKSILHSAHLSYQNRQLPSKLASLNNTRMHTSCCQQTVSLTVPDIVVGRVTCDEILHVDRVLLSNAMNTILCLHEDL